MFAVSQYQVNLLFKVANALRKTDEYYWEVEFLRIPFLHGRVIIHSWWLRRFGRGDISVCMDALTEILNTLFLTIGELISVRRPSVLNRIVVKSAASITLSESKKFLSNLFLLLHVQSVHVYSNDIVAALTTFRLPVLSLLS